MKHPKKEEIKKARNEAGLSLMNVAELLGVTKAAVTHWESGRRKMPVAAWELFLIKTKNVLAE